VILRCATYWQKSLFEKLRRFEILFDSYQGYLYARQRLLSDLPRRDSVLIYMHDKDFSRIYPEEIVFSTGCFAHAHEFVAPSKHCAANFDCHLRRYARHKRCLALKRELKFRIREDVFPSKQRSPSAGDAIHHYLPDAFSAA